MPPLPLLLHHERDLVVIDAPLLLTDLSKLVKRLEDDLRQRLYHVPEQRAPLQAEWQTARDAQRCAETFETWADQVITQAAVHWVLSGVFLRFMEDNELVERPWLSGPTEANGPHTNRLALARDRHEAYFRAHPLHSDRDYWLAAFREAATLPGLRTFFDEAHNPVFRLGISGDAAMHLREFWQQVNPNTGLLRHDFTDPTWNTRFLGDLYQDLSEATRKRYALLQTPAFVESFILDRTLTPALHEFGLHEVRLIDPTCGSGHFLLGAFHRLLALWQRQEPNRHPVDVTQKALDGVAGVDLNPFAVAITRFRLWVAALQASGVRRLAHAHDFKLSVAIGDSLLHGTRFGMTHSEDMFDTAASHADTGLAHAYASEDLAEVQRILGRQYHAVVGNPPYIVVKDAALNAAYRQKYASCHMKYSLGAPFTERFFDLALTGGHQQRAGYVGLITTNSFMKREFGAKLIEAVLPRLDLTHIVDTSGAYIPGHGTPTVILLGRHRPPVAAEVRTVMGIKGEPSTPADPAQGQVWQAIVGQVDQAGSESEFISVTDTPRATFAKHPWSIGGGGAAELREQLEKFGSQKLKSVTAAIGVMAVTGEDGIFVRENELPFVRMNVPKTSLREFIEGDSVRDWLTIPISTAIYEYNHLGCHDPASALNKYFWYFRALMQPAIYFGKTKKERGMHWREYGVIVKDKQGQTPTITFAEVATHNHFVLDRGGKVFKQTAPVIKLPKDSTEDDHLGLLGLLNSSVACFWMKQVCHNKGAGGDSTKLGGQPWENFYAFNSTKVSDFPLCPERPLGHARRLDAWAQQLAAVQPSALINSKSGAAYANKSSDRGHFLSENECLPTRTDLNAARAQAASLRRQMIATQEEMDWQCYVLYSLLRNDDKRQGHFSCENPPEIALGERAFEIVLARRVAAGATRTTWFERHGSTPITDLPAHWPQDYRLVVQRRIALIEQHPTVRLLEQALYKRRWNTPDWAEQEHTALREWLLTHLESDRYFPRTAALHPDAPPQLTSTSRLAQAASQHPDFMHMAALYAGHADVDPEQLVAQLVSAEAVPILPVQRYTESGLRKRQQWQHTWALQRREDAGEAVGPIPVPPKYQSKDFLKTDYWRLRGGLDVPKERWVSLPGCERGADGSLVIAWAGWNPLQQATAIASYYLDMKENEGWDAARLCPLLAALHELSAWLTQWHNDPDPTHGERMGDYYHSFITEEARSLGYILTDLSAWQPAPTPSARGRRAKA